MALVPRHMCFLALLISLATECTMAAGAATRSGKTVQECAPGCRRSFVGDKNCDRECLCAECKWDGGDCEDDWELKRVIVLGAYHDNVDHVEYELAGPGGQRIPVSIEEGRRWEGRDPVGAELAGNWHKALDHDDGDVQPMTYEHAPWQELEETVTL